MLSITASVIGQFEAPKIGPSLAEIVKTIKIPATALSLWNVSHPNDKKKTPSSNGVFLVFCCCVA